ncbi:DUF2586 domain-containing protein [Marinomonas sp. PE14-40]|uniref:DUF2586 domain-containing protein n=1 Tax=Marinomonas sp. PE14-40 TaxID=3060621 RepID=UPI003F673942
MALGQVSVSDVDSGQGDFSSPERQFLFIGKASANLDSILYLDQSSDLDALLGASVSGLKTSLAAAKANASANWTAVVMPRTNEGEWQTAFDIAMGQNIVCEAVVVADAITAQSELDLIATAIADTENSYGRSLFFVAATAAAATSDKWDAFISAFDTLQDGVASTGIMLIPEVFAGWMGTVCGRLCNEAVTIADTPMRTQTGAIVGLSTLPSDVDGTVFNMAHAKALNDARGTVPQVYPDYDGIYCSDGMTLAPEASDYAVIENLRVVNKAKRQVRILGIKKVGNRELNSTPLSIAAHETYFMRPIINMSKSLTSNGIYKPGEVKPPLDGDITISWASRTKVQIALLVRPYNCPKAIQAYIALNLTSEV